LQPDAGRHGGGLAVRLAVPFRMANLAVPADEDYLALARLTTMQVGGLLGLPAGRLTDLRLAVNEACALLLGGPADAVLELCFEHRPGELRITVRGPAPAVPPDPAGIGWMMLRALVGCVCMETAAGTATLTLTQPLVPAEARPARASAI
jgi:serine/threonine-protein kinase RsbW